MAVSRRIPVPGGVFVANCLASDAAGDCVYVSGPSVGGVVQVTICDPRQVPDQIPSIGVIQLKLSDTLCQVMVGGVLEDVYSGLTPQKQLWVGLDGRLTEDRYSVTGLSGQRVSVQQMGVVLAANMVLVQPQAPNIDVG